MYAHHRVGVSRRCARCAVLCSITALDTPTLPAIPARGLIHQFQSALAKNPGAPDGVEAVTFVGHPRPATLEGHAALPINAKQKLRWPEFKIPKDLRPTVTFSRTPFRGLPVVLPLVLAAHVVWGAITVWQFWGEPFPAPVWTAVGWILAFTAAWAGAAAGRKWGAIAYVVLSCANLVLHFLLAAPDDRALYTDALYKLDLIFSIVLLILYRRLR